jgi:hypothetical protein
VRHRTEGKVAQEASPLPTYDGTYSEDSFQAGPCLGKSYATDSLAKNIARPRTPDSALVENVARQSISASFAVQYIALVRVNGAYVCEREHVSSVGSLPSRRLPRCLETFVCVCVL